MQPQVYFFFFWLGGGSLSGWCSVGGLSIEHSSGAPLWTRARSHTHARTFAHFQTHSDLLSCPHRRLVPMLCHKSELSNRFYSFEWKEARQPSNNLEKTEESKSIVLLLLLKLVPGLAEWGERFFLCFKCVEDVKERHESIYTILSLEDDRIFGGYLYCAGDM